MELSPFRRVKTTKVKTRSIKWVPLSFMDTPREIQKRELKKCCRRRQGGWIESGSEGLSVRKNSALVSDRDVNPVLFLLVYLGCG